MLALAIHELLTNAIKYGALAGPSGRLSVNWRIDETPPDRRLVLEWADDESTPPVPAEPGRD